MVNNGELIDSLPVQDETIYLRTRASNKTKFANFEHSIVNTNFTQLGNALYMDFNLKVFKGNKFCLFKYANKETGGFVDFDWFRVE